MPKPKNSTNDATRIGTKHRGLLIALMLSSALVALDSTIIATAVPSVVKDLGGFAEFPWLFSIYVLAQAVFVPIFGRLADIHGRKPIMLAGIAIFFVGSIAGGFAGSMVVLIVCRAIQGIGAGAIQPVSMTISGDVFSLEQRGRIVGLMSSVYAIASVLGPTLGGVFSEYLSWRGIFFVNVPICILAATFVARGLKENVEHHGQRLDLFGAALLAIGTSMLILFLLGGGEDWAWASGWSFGILALSIASIIAFTLVERGVSQPMLPLWVFQRRVLLSSSIARLASGAIMLGLTTYIPTFSQRILGATALVGGFSLATLTIGWPVAAQFVGRVYMKHGFRTTALIGSVIVIGGCLLALLLNSSSNVWEVALFCAIIGFGMGWVVPPTSIAAQSSVAWKERGVVTGNNMFSGSLGSAIGVAAFGAIVNSSSPGSNNTDLGQALHTVFAAIVGVAVLMLIAVAFLPNRLIPATDILPEPEI